MLTLFGFGVLQLELQFKTGRLLACIASRPGQSGTPQSSRPINFSSPHPIYLPSCTLTNERPYPPYTLML